MDIISAWATAPFFPYAVSSALDPSPQAGLAVVHLLAVASRGPHRQVA